MSARFYDYTVAFGSNFKEMSGVGYTQITDIGVLASQKGEGGEGGSEGLIIARLQETQPR